MRYDTRRLHLHLWSLSPKLLEYCALGLLHSRLRSCHYKFLGYDLQQLRIWLRSCSVKFLGCHRGRSVHVSKLCQERTLCTFRWCEGHVGLRKCAKRLLRHRSMRPRSIEEIWRHGGIVDTLVLGELDVWMFRYLGAWSCCWIFPCCWMLSKVNGCSWSLDALFSGWYHGSCAYLKIIIVELE